jgi:hypothetical protein
LLKEKIGHSFRMAAFPEGMGNFFRKEAEKQNLEREWRLLKRIPLWLA